MPNHIFQKEYNRERFVQFADSTSVDAFGRLRVAEPVTLFDSKQIHDNQPLFWDDSETSGSGTSTSHSTDTASTTISVSANTAGKRVRRTFQRFNYQPGKSQLVIMTTQLSSQTTNLNGITASVGYFDDSNGVFFSAEDGVLYAVVRSSTSGSPVDTKIAQTDWNVDRFDGTGPSGITLDPSKTQILMFDMEWLGVGRVRFGFNVDGKNYVVHESLNANVLDKVYMSTANLPLTYEIENDGTGAATSLQHICGTVISEGGRQAIGLVQAVSNGTTEVTATNADTYYALKGIRLQSGHIGDTLVPETVNVAITSSGVFEWQLRFNPTVTGTFNYSNVTNAGFQEATGAGATVSGGTIVAQGYGASAGTGGSAAGTTGAELNNALLLGSAIDGTVDELVLCVASTSAGETFLGGITVRQLS